MPRLIDADDLEKRLHEMALNEWNRGTTTSWSNAFLECEDMVYDAQTVDAEPVVRCKDCGYWDATQELCWHMLTDDENGYCSWGERREDER